MRLSIGLAGLLVLAAPAVLAQDNKQTSSPQPTASPSSLPSSSPSKDDDNKTSEDPKETKTDEKKESSSETKSQSRTTDVAGAITGLPVTTSSTASTSVSSAVSRTGGPDGAVLTLPPQAGIGIPSVGVPDTSRAGFMQKSDLPDGTVFICVGAILAFFGASVLIWRGLVAWSLHRSVQNAARAQNFADLKDMSAMPGANKRGMYNVVGASSTMSLDHLSAAPTGTSKPIKPFANNPTGTPPKNNSLFFSPTAGNPGARDSMVNRSSQYLPAGYYAGGNAQAAGGSPLTHVGGAGSHLSIHSLAQPGNRFSARSGVSPPQSPSLPPSRGYDRAPPSRDGPSLYNRNSVATLGTPTGRAGVYGNDHGSASQLSLNVPGGSNTGGRAPSAYLEDLFENHGTGPQERY